MNKYITIWLLSFTLPLYTKGTVLFVYFLFDLFGNLVGKVYLCKQIERCNLCQDN